MLNASLQTPFHDLVVDAFPILVEEVTAKILSPMQRAWEERNTVSVIKSFKLRTKTLPIV